MGMARRRFQTAALMQAAVERYFYEREHDEDGEPLPVHRPVTMTGLARALGFSGLHSFYRYETYPDQDFKWVIDQARMRVMECYEENLHGTGATGSMFALKNMDPDIWRDKSEQIVDQRTVLVEKQDKAAALSQIKAALQERQLNSLPGEATVVEDDDSWMQ